MIQNLWHKNTILINTKNPIFHIPKKAKHNEEYCHYYTITVNSIL